MSTPIDRNTHCLVCRHAIPPVRKPRPSRVTCPGCGLPQPHLCRVSEYFDCLECGEQLDPPKDHGRVVLTCRRCGAARPFVRGPMVVITGSPGAGKSTLGIGLAPLLRNGVVIEHAFFVDDRYDSLVVLKMFREWLECAVGVAQGGRYLVVPSFARPHELDWLQERAYVGDIHWLALVCDDDELERRLRTRRQSKDIQQDELAGLMRINQEIRRIARDTPPVALIDSTRMTRDDVVVAALGVIGGWLAP